MTLKSSILGSIAILSGIVAAAAGFSSIKGFAKLFSLAPIATTQLTPGTEATSGTFTLPKSSELMVGLRYSIKSTDPSTSRDYSIPFEFRVLDSTGSVVSSQAVVVSEGHGTKHMHSFTETSEEWNASATDLEPIISIHPNSPYQVVATASIPRSAKYSAESLELCIFDGSSQPDVMRLVLIVIVATLSGLVFLGTSIAWWFLNRTKPKAILA